MLNTKKQRRIGTVAAAITLATVSGYVASPWSANAAPGDDDATFVPTEPCRLADTRQAPDRVGPNATFGPADTKTIDAHGTNGECTIPTDATGLALNVTALGATEAGNFVTVWPDGDRPLAANLNPAPGEPPTPNSVTTGLSDTGSFNVYNAVGSVDLVIDVNGYYTSSSLKALDEDIADLGADVEASDAAIAALEARIATLEGADPAASIPAGAVMAFSGTECPAEWSSFTAADGRVVVGAAAGTSIGATVGTPFSDLEDRTHAHEWVEWDDAENTWTSGDDQLIIDYMNGFQEGPTGGDGANKTPLLKEGGSATYLTSEASIDLPYVQLLMCEKD